MKNVRAAMTVATRGARDAVKAEYRATMPKSGGLNEWLAKSSIRSAVLTGPKTAGVVIRASKRGHDLRSINRTGKVRHPTFGHRGKGQWKETSVPDHTFEHALEPFVPAVRAALRVAQNTTAREAGFIE
jgi:hypothetical protein